MTQAQQVHAHLDENDRSNAAVPSHAHTAGTFINTNQGVPGALSQTSHIAQKNVKLIGERDVALLKSTVKGQQNEKAGQ